MASEAALRLVGTIRSIELHTLASRFRDVTTRQVAKVQLDIERATDADGTDLDAANLANVAFQGPPELVPRFAIGERVQLETSAEMHIISIKSAPLS